MTSLRETAHEANLPLVTENTESRILVVDDRPDKLLALTTVLDSLGQPVVTAGSGAEALRILLRDDFAVILLDVSMPEMDGFETAALIRQRARTEFTPIIFVTSINTNETHVSRGYSLGAVDYIFSPIEPEILRAKVAVFIELHRKTLQIQHQAELLRVKAERKATNIEARLRHLLKALNVGVFRLSASGKLLDANRTFYELAGVESESEMLELGPLLRSLIEDGSGRMSNREACFRDRGGNERWLALSYHESSDDSGARVFDGLAEDISLRKQAEKERESLLGREQAARSEAERANRLKDEFLSILSHELRTPLNAIMGWAQLLRAGKLSPEESAQAVQVIERNSKIQSKIISDLLDMSAILSGKVQLEIRPVSIGELLQSAIETVRTTAEAKGITLRAPDPLPMDEVMDGDQHRLQQILWNLLSNAVKFTPAQGEVRVGLRLDQECVEFTVSDSGLGIDPHFLPHIYERFRQADSSITRKHGGLGLGLSIVKQLVELHDGLIAAHSEGPNRGAVFSVRFPRFVENAQSSCAQPAEEPVITRAELRGVRVLVVDDEPDSLLLIKRILEDNEADVITASSASEALHLFERSRPDVLISDIGMPGEDGFDLLRKIRALGASRGGAVPAVALTAFASAEDTRKAILSGFQAHVTKPVEPSGVISAVSDARSRHMNGAGNSHAGAR